MVKKKLPQWARHTGRGNPSEEGHRQRREQRQSRPRPAGNLQESKSTMTSLINSLSVPVAPVRSSKTIPRRQIEHSTMLSAHAEPTATWVLSKTTAPFLTAKRLPSLGLAAVMRPRVSLTRTLACGVPRLRWLTNWSTLAFGTGLLPFYGKQPWPTSRP
ncbi:hypothetical protein BCR44DRAFT_1445387, partial [Catenaria anguillulae PL171]